MINKLADRIFLCGFMGAGKTTIGRQLSEKMSVPFLDLDDHIRKQAGKSIAEIFEEDGEQAFRKIERKSLLEVIRTFKGVVALGGGSLQNQHIVDHVKVNGLLIFIETPFSVILKRITTNAERPLLVDDQGSLKNEETLNRELKELYDQRLPFYEQAELKVTYETGTPGEVTNKLIKKIKYHVSHY